MYKQRGLQVILNNDVWFDIIGHWTFRNENIKKNYFLNFGSVKVKCCNLIPIRILDIINIRTSIRGNKFINGLNAMLNLLPLLVVD